MSKPVKEMVRQVLVKRFEGMTSLAVVGFTGLDAITTNSVRDRLRSKDIRLTVVKNSLARQAFKSMGLEAAADLLEGPCAVAYGSDPARVTVINVVRELLEIGKDSPALTVKAAMMEGDLFRTPDQVEALSKFPTREEAVSQLLGAILAVGGNVAACIVGPSSQVASLVAAVEDKKSKEPAPAEAVPAAEPAPAAAPETAPAATSAETPA